jgi:hypothetical protein
MLKASRIILIVCMTAFLVGCNASGNASTTTSLPVTQTHLSSATVSGPTRTPTVTTSVVGSGTPLSSNASEVLNAAVANLLKANSFDMSVHEVRAYRIIDANSETRLVYGEFISNYTVIRLPTLKVHSRIEYRYDPQADFYQFDTYSYLEGSKYFSRTMEISGSSDAVEIDPEQIEPVASDVYQTLSTYSDQAKFAAESGGIAVYILEHPKWYTLKGAIGFADLGFLYLQESGNQLVEQYVAERYPNVKPIVFTIFVDIDENWITKVEVNDRDFMESIWAEVDRALIEHGEKPENLTRYEVMDVNGAEYLFGNYNQVHDFEIP